MTNDEIREYLKKNITTENWIYSREYGPILEKIGLIVSKKDSEYSEFYIMMNGNTVKVTAYQLGEELSKRSYIYRNLDWGEQIFRILMDLTF